MVAGGIAAALFGVSLWAVITKRTWSINLVTALALFDMIGEFVAQGTMGIMVTLSFIVATLLLIFTVTYRKQLNQTGILTEESLPDWERPRARKTFPPRSRVRVSDGRVPVDGEDVFENSVSIRRGR